MSDPTRKALRTLWNNIHERELAGLFPHELLVVVGTALNPFRCERCGGVNVQCAMMVRINTNEVQEDFGSWKETDTKWCEDCEKHVQLVQASDEEEDNDART